MYANFLYSVLWHFHHIKFFQFAFACALSSIVAGTIAERCKMAAYLCYSIFLCGFVYPVCAHSFWSVNGFLSPFATDPLWGSGALDLAGSGPVHMCGGVAALCMAVVLGPRLGRFYDDDGIALEEPKAMGPHSVSLQVSTVIILIATVDNISVAYFSRALPALPVPRDICSLVWLVWFQPRIDAKD